MKDDKLEIIEKNVTEVPSVATDAMPQQISNALNALLDTHTALLTWPSSSMSSGRAVMLWVKRAIESR